MTAKTKISKCYAIWFSQRNGSSLLCEGLKSTGVLGKPEEHFNIATTEKLLTKYQARDYPELQEMIYQRGSTPNGVFGVKTNAPKKQNDLIVEELRHFPKAKGCSGGNYEVWQSVFPSCKHIFITRRHKVRQAISWWKAIVTDEWHRKTNDAEVGANRDFVDKYDFNAIKHLLIEITLRESKIQAFLDEGGRQALTIVYEDFTKDYEKTILRVARFLGVEVNRSAIAPPFYSQLADDISDEWTERFRKEIQSDWTNQIW